MRTILIGDLHGCLDELEDLLRACDASERDRVISVGDLVAKGPDSRGVVRRFRRAGWQAVLGNHDAHVLRWRAAKRAEARARGRLHHFEVARSLDAADADWLAALPLWLELPASLGGGVPVRVVHAGFVPGVPLAQQEREQLLNLRSLRADGAPSARVEGTPWAAAWPGPEHVVFGHDALRGLQQHPRATGLDTGCVYGGRLTALVLPERRLVSVPARRAYLPID